jgi:hypothetical protein
MMREAREELGATAGADGQRGGQRWNVDGGPVGVEVTARGASIRLSITAMLCHHDVGAAAPLKPGKVQQQRRGVVYKRQRE